MDEAETKGLKVCLGSMVVSVDMAELVSKVELLDEKVQDMARLVEVTMEVLVETDDRTSCPASWMEFDSSFFPSYKVQTGSLPTEVETEGAAYSENARSLSCMGPHHRGKNGRSGRAGLSLSMRLRCGCAPGIGDLRPVRVSHGETTRKSHVGPLRMQ